MIYLNLKGGLCNMLFQIATAKSFSIEKKTDFSIMNLDEHLQMLYNLSSEMPTLINSFEYGKLRMLSGVLTKKPNSDLPTYSYPFEYTKYNISLRNCPNTAWTPLYCPCKNEGVWTKLSMTSCP